MIIILVVDTERIKFQQLLEMWTIPSIVYCASFYYRQVVESTFHFLQSIGPHYNGPAPWQEGVHTLLYLLLDDKEMMTFSIMFRFFDFEYKIYI